MFHIIILFIASFFINPDDCQIKMPEVRAAYGNIQTEEQLLEFIQLVESVECDRTGPYMASATMQRAQFALAPWTKYRYFQKGRKMLEKYISDYPMDIEARYVRFLVQTHAPFFLGYNKQIHNDASMIRSNIEGYGLSMNYQTQILSHLDQMENK